MSRHPSPDPNANSSSFSGSTTSSTSLVTSSSSRKQYPKSRFPYTVGSIFSAKRHTPPDPFGYLYEGQWPPRKEGWEKLSKIDFCWDQPPLPGDSSDNVTVDFKITELICTGKSRGAQVVQVDQDKVAKIFDPLYYQGMTHYGTKEDVVGLADGDYSREAAAYQELQQDPKATDLIPKYHGSWTIEVKTFKKENGEIIEKNREVRLILIAFVKGRRMDSIPLSSLSKKERFNVLAKVLEAGAAICHAGVDHGDMCPRNIIIVGNNLKSKNLKVKVIDFNAATVLRLCNGESWNKKRLAYLKSKEPKIMSPISRFWGCMTEFQSGGWVSDLNDDAEKWLLKTFQDDERYIPLVHDGEFSHTPISEGWKEFIMSDINEVSDAKL